MFLIKNIIIIDTIIIVDIIIICRWSQCMWLCHPAPTMTVQGTIVRIHPAPDTAELQDTADISPACLSLAWISLIKGWASLDQDLHKALPKAASVFICWSEFDIQNNFLQFYRVTYHVFRSFEVPSSQHLSLCVMLLNVFYEIIKILSL